MDSKAKVENYNSLDNSMRGIDEMLEKIDLKYNNTPIKTSGSIKKDLSEKCMVLSEEFQTLGIPGLNLEKPLDNVLRQIVTNSHLLVHLHRKSLQEMSDISIQNTSKDSRNFDLEKVNADLKTKLRRCSEQNASLENKITSLKSECKELKKQISAQSEETEKLKRYFKSKENDLVHQVNKTERENFRLKEICGKEAGKHVSNDEQFMKIIKKYRKNEDMYKSKIKKLEDNNTAFVNEVINLKEELALSYILPEK